jgi:hypothetical protein
MIEGLKVTIHQKELRQLCMNRAQHHLERQGAYRAQIDSMEENQIEGMHYSGGDPMKALRDKLDQHGNEAMEMIFIADHLKAGEEYMLDATALHKLGIIKSRY